MALAASPTPAAPFPSPTCRYGATVSRRLAAELYQPVGDGDRSDPAPQPHQTVGLCNVPVIMQKGITTLLQCADEKEVVMQVAGLNHFIFVRQILHKGKEWLPEVIAEINAGRDRWCRATFRRSVGRRICCRA